MKKIILLIGFCLSIQLLVCAHDLSTLRELMHKAADDKESAAKLIHVLEQPGEVTASIQSGYKGMAFMLLSKHALSPFSKLNYFRKGKTFLEDAISKDTNNIELRYLRFSVQVNVPGFLNYSSNMEEDKRIILKGIANFNDRKFRNRIVSFMLSCDVCSDGEKRELKTNLDNGN